MSKTELAQEFSFSKVGECRGVQRHCKARFAKHSTQKPTGCMEGNGWPQRWRVLTTTKNFIKIL